MSEIENPSVALWRQLFLDNPNPALACFPDGSMDQDFINTAARLEIDRSVSHSELFLPLDHVEKVRGCWETAQPQLAVLYRHENPMRIDYIPAKEAGRVLVFLHQFEVTERDYRLLSQKHRQLQNESVLADLVEDFGIVKRKYFMEQLTLALSGVQLGLSSAVAVAVLDVNKFRQINESLGHSCGDEALRKVAKAIADASREDDIIGRIGNGDEFGIIVFNTRGAGAYDLLEELAFRIRDNLAKPIQLGEKSWTIGVSIGGAVFRSGSTYSAADLLAEADKAMYRNKKQRRRENITFAELESLSDLLPDE